MAMARQMRWQFSQASMQTAVLSLVLLWCVSMTSLHAGSAILDLGAVYLQQPAFPPSGSGASLASTAGSARLTGHATRRARRSGVRPRDFASDVRRQLISPHVE